MVVALGPGKFYGSSLPRPRIYTDIKFNSERVDPPLPVLDPLMSWAEEAHWSMGGLSFHRHRLQGRIEGNVEKLRNQIEKSVKEKESFSPKLQKNKKLSKKKKQKKKKIGVDVRLSESPKAPLAPIASKRKRRYVGLVDEDDEGEGERGLSSAVGRKWPVRKLSDEFDLVASGKKTPEIGTVASRTRGRKSEEGVKSVVAKGKKRLRKVASSV